VDLGKGGGTGWLLDGFFSEAIVGTLEVPTFVTDFPKEISPLAKTNRRDPRLVERFELFAAGMELANAFSEQNDPLEQEAAFDLQTALRAAGDLEAQQKDMDYLHALEIGMPPTGGVGIGVDRLTMLLTDSRNIREVILFPLLRQEEGEETASAPVVPSTGSTSSPGRPPGSPG
jgi:lysyl-tRNA synthetase class 2